MKQNKNQKKQQSSTIGQTQKPQTQMINTTQSSKQDTKQQKGKIVNTGFIPDQTNNQIQQIQSNNHIKNTIAQDTSGDELFGEEHTARLNMTRHKRDTQLLKSYGAKCNVDRRYMEQTLSADKSQMKLQIDNMFDEYVNMYKNCKVEITPDEDKEVANHITQLLMVLQYKDKIKLQGNSDSPVCVTKCNGGIGYDLWQKTDELDYGVTCQFLTMYLTATSKQNSDGKVLLTRVTAETLFYMMQLEVMCHHIYDLGWQPPLSQSPLTTAKTIAINLLCGLTYQHDSDSEDAELDYDQPVLTNTNNDECDSVMEKVRVVNTQFYGLFSSFLNGEIGNHNQTQELFTKPENGQAELQNIKAVISNLAITNYTETHITSGQYIHRELLKTNEDYRNTQSEIRKFLGEIKSLDTRPIVQDAQLIKEQLNDTNLQVPIQKKYFLSTNGYKDRTQLKVKSAVFDGIEQDYQGETNEQIQKNKQIVVYKGNSIEASVYHPKDSYYKQVTMSLGINVIHITKPILPFNDYQQDIKVYDQLVQQKTYKGQQNVVQNGARIDRSKLIIGYTGKQYNKKVTTDDFLPNISERSTNYYDVEGFQQSVYLNFKNPAKTTPFVSDVILVLQQGSQNQKCYYAYTKQSKDNYTYIGMVTSVKNEFAVEVTDCRLMIRNGQSQDGKLKIQLGLLYELKYDDKEQKTRASCYIRSADGLDYTQVNAYQRYEAVQAWYTKFGTYYYVDQVYERDPNLPPGVVDQETRVYKSWCISHNQYNLKEPIDMQNPIFKNRQQIEVNNEATLPSLQDRIMNGVIYFSDKDQQLSHTIKYRQSQMNYIVVPQCPDVKLKMYVDESITKLPLIVTMEATFTYKGVKIVDRIDVPSNGQFFGFLHQYCQLFIVKHRDRVIGLSQPNRFIVKEIIGEHTNVVSGDDPPRDLKFSVTCDDDEIVQIIRSAKTLNRQKAKHNLVIVKCLKQQITRVRQKYLSYEDSDKSSKQIVDQDYKVQMPRILNESNQFDLVAEIKTSTSSAQGVSNIQKNKKYYTEGIIPIVLSWAGLVTDKTFKSYIPMPEVLSAISHLYFKQRVESKLTMLLVNRTFTFKNTAEQCMPYIRIHNHEDSDEQVII